METPALLTLGAERADSAAEPLPRELDWPRLRGRLLAIAAGLAAIAAVVALLPGLGAVRRSLAGARPDWLLLAAVLEVLSCVSYVAVFRGVFCPAMPWRASFRIGAAELAANSALSVGGAGGLALGAWILRRAGMPAGRVARRTVAFFLVTSLANVGALIVAGAGLGSGVLHGAPPPGLGWAPAGLGAAAIAAALALPSLARGLAGRVGHATAARGLQAVAGGVDEAVALLRARDPLVLAGAAGYMLFDVAMLGVCFTAFGDAVPPAGVLLMAYLIGQLGGLVPMPAGLGGVDGGLIGTLVLYGAGATAAATAVLAYRAIVLLLPVALGLPALLSLRRELRGDARPIEMCGAAVAAGYAD